MPIYTLRQSDGSDLAIDTSIDGYELLPPSIPGAVCDIATWGRRNALQEPQAAELAKIDFDLRRKLPGGCPGCFFHDRRPEPGDCDRLCCELRQVGLVAGVELSPYVTAAPPPAAKGADPAPRLLVMGAAWGLSFAWLHERAPLVPLGFLALAVLLLVIVKISEARGRSPRGRGDV